MSRKIVIGILIILYLVGFIGIGLEVMPEIVWLTPINLLITLLAALYFDEKKAKSLLLFCVVVFLLGYGAEVAGIQTGKIFGVYQYGDILGPKIWDTPPMIGVNWVLLVYCCGYTLNTLIPSVNSIFKALLGASLLVILDLIIEPVAISWGMWTWAAVDIPLQNYIAWWLIAFVMMNIFFKSFEESTNKVALSAFILQFLFFGLLNL